MGKKIARLQIGLRGVREEDRGQKFGKKPLQIGLRGVEEEDRGQRFEKKAIDNN